MQAAGTSGCSGAAFAVARTPWRLRAPGKERYTLGLRIAPAISPATAENGQNLALFPAGEDRRVLVLRAKGIAVNHGENSLFQGRVLVAGRRSLLRGLLHGSERRLEPDRPLS